jgi:hypothetical protein
VIRWALLPIASLMVLGCQVAVVDLGSNHPVSAGGTGGASDAGPVTTMDCPYTNEAEIQALYGHPCTSTCADGQGPPRVVASSVELVAVTTGKWLTCTGEVPWPNGVVGIEFQDGCTLFLLYDAAAGGVTRGIAPTDQGTYNVVETTYEGSLTRTVELYFPTWTWRVAVTTSDCPHSMQLAGEDGGVTTFVAVTSTAPPSQ